MSARLDPTVTIPWMNEGTDLFRATLAALDDEEFTAPSNLADWTNAHVAAHVAQNAEALCRLVHWARTGEETPMYPSRESRNENIERGAQASPAELRLEVERTGLVLDETLAEPDIDWSAALAGATGRNLPAAEIPWLRVREVWLHGLDLRPGTGPAQISEAVARSLLDEVTTSFSGRDDAPALTLRAPDHEWDVEGDGAPTVVTGPVTHLATWLVGRGGHDRLKSDGDGLPQLPAWL